MVQKFKIFILIWNLVRGLFRICKIRWWCSLFCFISFFTSFIQDICWYFDVTWLMSQQFTRRNLSPVAFLVLPYQAVLHPFFSFFYFKPLVTPLFIQLFCNNNFTFCILLFFWNKQTSNFHTLNMWTNIARIVTLRR